MLTVLRECNTLYNNFKLFSFISYWNKVQSITMLRALNNVTKLVYNIAFFGFLSTSDLSERSAFATSSPLGYEIILQVTLRCKSLPQTVISHFILSSSPPLRPIRRTLWLLHVVISFSSFLFATPHNGKIFCVRFSYVQSFWTIWIWICIIVIMIYTGWVSKKLHHCTVTIMQIRIQIVKKLCTYENLTQNIPM